MILLEDTRQQAKKHEAKHRWFAENGVDVVRSKLVVIIPCQPTRAFVLTQSLDCWKFAVM